jgi:hypothetical protein
MVARPAAGAISALPVTFDRLTTKSSLGSMTASPMRGTVNCAVTWPGLKVTIPVVLV